MTRAKGLPFPIPGRREHMRTSRFTEEQRVRIGLAPDLGDVAEALGDAGVIDQGQ